MLRGLVAVACAGLFLLPTAGADEGGLPAGGQAAQTGSTSVAPSAPEGWDAVPLPPAVHKGLKWLVLSQQADGGWSERGGRIAKPVRSPRVPGVPVPDAPDVGNTSLAALALFAAGNTPSKGTFQATLRRAVTYILVEVEQAKEKGLAVTDRTGTQLQRKIGRYADTFLAARVLVRADGTMPSAAGNARVGRALEKVLRKIQDGQAEDGSWHTQGGWAPIHSTAYASQALEEAQARGHDIDRQVMIRVERFTERAVESSLRPPVVRKAPKKPRKAPKKPRKTPKRRGAAPVITPSSVPPVGRDAAGAAGVPLYSLSQGIEQMTRTPRLRKRYVRQIEDIRARVQNESTLKGLGSMGGEEFISYANIGLAMARIGGARAEAWRAAMQERLAGLQNADGSWSGHHCITGRTAVTGLAISAMLAERSVPLRD